MQPEQVLYELSILRIRRQIRQKGPTMKQIGEFTLDLGKKKFIPVEVLVDNDNTLILIDCNCCEEFLSRRLPGGVLIPIATALKTFFETRGMRNIDVNVSGVLMRRTYKGIMDVADLPEMTRELEQAVNNFTRKRKKR
jgi:hypothetical protein